MKRSILVVLVLLLLGANIISAQETVTVEIYFPISVDSPITEILNGYAEAYMSENDGVEIVWSFEGGYGDVKNRLLTVAEGGGDVPALAIMLATDIYDLRNAEVIQSLDAFASEDYLSDFVAAWLANSYYDFDGDGTGELYSVPFQRSTVLLYYNADLLADAGLDVPTNWEELATTAQALTTDEREGILIPNSWPYWLFQPFAAGSGQNIVSDSDTEVFFNNDDVVEALNFWVALYEEYDATPDGVQSNWGDAPGAFLDGSAAMILHSSGSLRTIIDNADFEFGVSGIPGQDGGSFTVTGGGNLYMSADIDDATAQAAWDFVEWLTAPERTVDWSINAGYYNTRESGFELDAWTAFSEENPQVDEARATIDSAVREFSVQSLGDIRNILHAQILAVLNGETDAASAMEQAQTEAESILSIFE
ncbi:MAG: ABC transporter substrate-binding protein [Anaerolineae bacterium]|nr:ABC transporter substrate-binding protein [Anaerolineae bacterium]MDQ7036805.1 ABC transporter substrate-binding protein [Anaerolineae bacterium]